VFGTFATQSNGGVLGAAGGSDAFGGFDALQALVDSDDLSPMIRMHEPKNEPFPSKLIGLPVVLEATWNDVLIVPLVVALMTK